MDSVPVDFLDELVLQLSIYSRHTLSQLGGTIGCFFDNVQNCYKRYDLAVKFDSEYSTIRYQLADYRSFTDQMRILGLLENLVLPRYSSIKSLTLIGPNSEELNQSVSILTSKPSHLMTFLRANRRCLDKYALIIKSAISPQMVADIISILPFYCERYTADNTTGLCADSICPFLRKCSQSRLCIIKLTEVNDVPILTRILGTLPVGENLVEIVFRDERSATFVEQLKALVKWWKDCPSHEAEHSFKAIISSTNIKRALSDDENDGDCHIDHPNKKNRLDVIFCENYTLFQFC